MGKSPDVSMSGLIRKGYAAPVSPEAAAEPEEPTAPPPMPAVMEPASAAPVPVQRPDRAGEEGTAVIPVPAAFVAVPPPPAPDAVSTLNCKIPTPLYEQIRTEQFVSRRQQKDIVAEALAIGLAALGARRRGDGRG